MARVLWKEWREKRLWTLLFLAFVLVPGVVCGETLSFSGHLGTTSFWTMAVILPALLLGMTTFSRETGYECQDFLFSRPIAWKQILFAKLLVDGGIMLGSVVIGAVVFWLTLPKFSVHFIGIGDLLSGIAIGFGAMLIGYIPGLGTSVVVPGVLGSGVVLCLAGATGGVESVFIANMGGNALFGLIAAWVLGGVSASVLMGKRGLGLVAADRAKRYALLIVVISTLMLSVTIPIANRIRLPEKPESVMTDISPDGRYLLIEPENSAKPWRVVRRSDKASAPLSYAIRTAYGYVWNDDSLIFYSRRILLSLTMDDSGKLFEKEYGGKLNAHSIDISPDGRYAAIYREPENYNDRLHHIEFVDTRSMSTIKSFTIRDTEGLWMRWRSNNVLLVHLYGSDSSPNVDRLFYITPKGIESKDRMVKR